MLAEGRGYDSIQTSNWQKISEQIVCLFMFVSYVASKKRTSAKISRILSYPVKNLSTHKLVS